MTTTDVRRRDASAAQGIKGHPAAADLAARRARFLALTDRLRRDTEGRQHTPSQDLIREDRDGGHRPWPDEFVGGVDSSE